MLRTVHEVSGWGVVVANGLVGLWTLAAHWLPRLRSRYVWWATAIAQVAIFGAVIIGVVLMTTQDIEPSQFHMFYGFVAAATVGLIYSYRHQLEAHRYLLYGFGGLFLMGLVLRAIQLSGPG